MTSFVEVRFEPTPPRELAPLQRQIAQVCDWLTDSAKAQGPQFFATQRGIQQLLNHLPEALWLPRNGWADWERRAALERVLGLFVELQRPGVVEDFLWSQLKHDKLARAVARLPPHGPWPRLGPTFTEQHYFQQASVAVQGVADAARRLALEVRQAWVARFLANDAFGIGTRRRLGEVGRTKLLEELAHLRTYLLHPHEDFRHEDFLPPPSAVLLAAHDAAQSPDSRLARLSALVENFCRLYETEHHDSESDERGARAFVQRCRAHLLHRAAASFSSMPLSMQVAAVDYVRDLLMCVCERRHRGRGMPRAFNVIAMLDTLLDQDGERLASTPAELLDHLQRDDGAAWCDNLVAAFTGTATGTDEHAHETAPSLRSFGVTRSSRFFPEPRRVRS